MREVRSAEITWPLSPRNGSEVRFPPDNKGGGAALIVSGFGSQCWSLEHEES